MKKTLLTFFSLFSFMNIHAQCSLEFGSAAGTFTFAYASGSDIVNGASGGANSTSSQSFDIWNETTAPIDCSAGGGANDITFDFQMVHAFDANTPGDGIIDAFAGGTHDIIQSTSGLRGTTPLGNSGTNETSTGDVRGYQITVSFANHININADEIVVNTTSVNTKGTAFESCAIVFLDDSGNPYGTATYEGFYGSGSAGASTNASCSAPSSGVAWSTTGTGVYTMQSPNTVMQDPSSLCDIIGDTNGPDNNKDVEPFADAGLNATDKIGGFIFRVYLEDVAPSAAPGANTSTTTSFTSTLNGITLNIPLPVELTSFDANVSDANVFLNWNTASESDNDYFEIQRSSNGIDFAKIGEIKGVGQSNLPSDYRFVDAQPEDGINYYRLKQVDFNGKTELSKIVFIDFKKEKKVNLFPTISTNEINITLPEISDDVTYKILNFTGQIIQEGSFDDNSTTYKINVQNFSNGNYLIQIGNKSFSKVLRFNKI